MKLKPLANRVVVKPTEPEQKTKGGIIIPNSAKDNNTLYGVVISVGPGTKNEEMIVKENDTIIYGRYGGIPIEIEGEKMIILKQSDIIAIVK